MKSRTLDYFYNLKNKKLYTRIIQYGTVEDFISAFEHLDFRTEGMSDTRFRKCFINGLKDEICAHVLMAHPQTWLEATQRAKEAQ